MKFVVHAERKTTLASPKMSCARLTSGEVILLPCHVLTVSSCGLDVQTCILSGHIDDATDRLNANFPSTLPSSASTYADAESSTPTEAEERSQSKLIKTVLPFTVEPAHLYLNLRILAFIEAARTKPLLYPFTIPTVSDSEPSALISPPNNFRDPSGEADGDAHLDRLLKHVHEIYDCAQALQDPHDRAEYQHELSAVSSLLAYKVPEQSPMAKYLTQERREAVADEINSAILCTSFSSLVSGVEILTRWT
jgi:CTLH/CRA C-terminal to LisH motif domain